MVLGIFTWLAGTRIGRMVAAAGAVIVAAAALYGKGRRDATLAQEHDALKSYAKTRKRADDALRRAKVDTRPADERLKEHGRLRK